MIVILYYCIVIHTSDSNTLLLLTAPTYPHTAGTITHTDTDTSRYPVSDTRLLVRRDITTSLVLWLMLSCSKLRMYSASACMCKGVNNINIPDMRESRQQD